MYLYVGISFPYNFMSHAALHVQDVFNTLYIGQIDLEDLGCLISACCLDFELLYCYLPSGNSIVQQNLQAKPYTQGGKTHALPCSQLAHTLHVGREDLQKASFQGGMH